MQFSVKNIHKHITLSHLFFIFAILFGFLFPNKVHELSHTILIFFAENFDWFIVLSCTLLLVGCIYLAFSKIGNIVLGNDGDKPEFSNLSWFSMLYAAGMGSGLVVHGAAEPLLHFYSPPPQSEMLITQPQMLRQAMSLTYLHWGFHAWAIYAICGVTIAYFTFRHNKSFQPSSPLRHAWGESKKLNKFYHIVNLFSVLAVAFGMIASLSAGILQIYSGLEHIDFSFGSKNQMLLMILIPIAILYICSALTGLKKGIQLLSNINMFLCFGIMLFILLTGPTHFIMQTFVTSFGDYLADFFRMGLDLRHYNGKQEWTSNWTITYWLWWIAWGPFVGVFLARISKGRTIRQFILGTVIVPTVFSILWFSIFGGTALYMDIFSGANLNLIADKDITMTSFFLFDELPFSYAMNIFTIILSAIFLISGADSAAYVLALFTSHEHKEPEYLQKLFWGSILAIIVAFMLITSKDITFIRAISVLGALPYLLIIILQSYAFLKEVYKEKLIHEK